MARPPIKYARNAAGLHIAYWTVGDGPPDIVYVPNLATTADLFWMSQPVARFLRRLAAIGRLTQFDTSGTGASDAIAADKLPTMEQWMDDVRVVMDAEGIERATLIGHDTGGPVASLFAASHPDRVAGLVLVGAYARVVRAPGYPAGYAEGRQTEVIENWLRVWGTGTQIEMTAPSVGADDEVREWFAVAERQTKMQMRRPLFEMIQSIDIRHVLPAIRVPTLVIHREGDRYIRVGHGRYLGEHIPRAKYVELPGDDHYMFFGDTDPILEEIREFVTGIREDPFDSDRVLATLLFTDIVDSTGRATDLGDKRWRELLDRHDEIVRDALRRFRGREIKTTGDGFLATFDGPARAIRCAVAVKESVRPLGIELRAGIHSGEVELRGDDIGGIAVHIGARVMAKAGPAEVVVSGTVPPLVAGAGIEFEDRGVTELKGVPGEWRLFVVKG